MIAKTLLWSAFALQVFAAEEKKAEVSEIDPLYDYAGSTMIGITTIIAVVWWFIGWFLYIPTNLNRDDVENLRNLWNDGEKTIPIGWFWSRFSEPNLGLTAWMYFSIFVIYGFVGVVEFFAWLMYLGGNDQLLTFWAPSIGFWGSIIFYTLPWIFAAAQLSVFRGDVYLNGYSNAFTMWLVFMANWVFTGLVNWYYMEGLMAHLHARANKDHGMVDPCICEPVDVNNCSASKAKCTERLSSNQCVKMLADHLYSRCTAVQLDGESDARLEKRCRSQYFSSCSLVRKAGESDRAYLVRCKVDETHKCDAHIDHHIDVVIVEEDLVDEPVRDPVVVTVVEEDPGQDW